MGFATVLRVITFLMKAKVVCFFALLFHVSFGFSQGTAFTYQGRLNATNGPANGIFDLQFILRDAPSGGNGIGTNQVAPVSVSNGLFTVTLNFGAAGFDGSARWLQIGVRTNGSGAAYAVLTPTQPITPAPYAIHAAGATIPAGSVMAYMGTNAPSGWLLCDGAEVSRTTYVRLFNVIGVANGSGNGSTTFNLPDLRGTFLRGLDGVANIDPDKAARTAAKAGGNVGNALGSLQADQFKSHNHVNGTFNRVLQVSINTATTAKDNDVSATEPDVVNSAPLSAAGGNETRPRNIYVNYIIKD